jgi:hypothetical protein
LATRLNAATSRLLVTSFQTVYQRADAITVPSSGLKRRLIDRGAPERKISVVYDSVDEETCVPVERDPTLAAEFGVTSHFKTIGTFNGLFARLVDGMPLMRPCAPRRHSFSNVNSL